MTTTTRQLDIRRIYSARPARAAVVSAGKTRALRVSILGVMSLVMAAAWVYVTWWPADRLIQRNLMLAGLANMPVSAGVLDFSQTFGEAPDDLANPAPPEGTEAAVQTDDEVEQAVPEPMATDPKQAATRGQRIMQSLYVDMWVWLGVSTLAAVWLAAAGGAAAAGFPVADAAKRRRLMTAAAVVALIALWIATWLWKAQGPAGLLESCAELALVCGGLAAAYLLAVSVTARVAGLLAIALALALAGIGGWAWRDWHTQSFTVFESYPTVALRIVAVVLVVVAALAGAAMFRRSVGLHRVAVVLILAAAITTAAALKYAESTGGVHTHTLTGTTYLALAVAQVACAAVLAGALALRLR